MSILHALFLTLFFFGCISAAYWIGDIIYRAWRYIHRPEVLSDPQPDERDEMAEFRRIIDEQQS
jgi:hypothetical protein